MVSVTDLRVMHSELQALGIRPVTETLSLMEASNILAYLPRDSARLLVAFVIRGESTLPSRHAVLFTRREARLDWRAVLNMLQDAVPGDRVVVVGVDTRGAGKVVGASGVYRVITLT